MLYWAMLKSEKVFIEAAGLDAARQLAQGLANEGGPAYSVDVNPVQFPELQTVTLIRADGTLETIEWRAEESDDVTAVRKAVVAL